MGCVCSILICASCMRVYGLIPTYIEICMCTYYRLLHTHTRTQTHAHTHIHRQVHAHLHTHTHTHTHAHTYTHTHAHRHTHIHMYTCIHEDMHTHILCGVSICTCTCHLQCSYARQHWFACLSARVAC